MRLSAISCMLLTSMDSGPATDNSAEAGWSPAHTPKHALKAKKPKATITPVVTLVVLD
jgi:hypothetical protein